MAQIISIRNSLTEEPWVPFTRTTFDEASGVTAIRWQNPSGFTLSWAIQIGETGEEQTEIRVLSTDAPAGTAGTITAATDFSHPADTPIYGIKYDKVVFGVDTGGTNTAGTVATITSGTVNIGADSENTILDYSSGTSTDAYKVKFRNSVTTDESELSDWILPGGLKFHTLGRIRDRTKAKLFDSGYIKSDDTINDWVNEWRETMTNEAVDVNEDYSIGTVDITFTGTQEFGTITNADFNSIRRMRMKTGGTSVYNATKMEQIDFDDQQTFSESRPYFYMVTDNVFGRKPNNSTGTAEISYYSNGTELTNDSDELPHSMRGYSKSFVHYSLAQAYLKDGKQQEFTNEMSLANADLGRFKAQLVPRSQTGVTQIKYVESVLEDEWI